jgi:transcriptional regulator with XRE-family HTH domain
MSKPVHTPASLTIAEYRKLSAMSQVEVARRLDVSQPLVSSWECGRVTPGINDVRRLEKLFNTEPGEMLFKIAYFDMATNPNAEILQ